MAIELIPSSFRCDWCHQSDFFENTVREMEKKRKSKRVRSGDGEGNEYTIVFYKGKAIEILCSKPGTGKINPIVA